MLDSETGANAVPDNGLTDIMTTGVSCHVCRTPIHRPPSQVAKSKRLFCSRKCYFSTRQVTPYVQWREGQRRARKAVAQFFQLGAGYVVHHHDGDNRNNHPSNLAVFRNQSDHMAYHHGVTVVRPLWDGREVFTNLI